MAYRNKTYVAFDGDNDMWAYAYMKGWKQNDSSSFNFYDAHDLNTARDSSTEESIKRQLRERMNNSKVFVLLIGEHTKYLTKFVKWEVEQFLKKDLPIICVNLNKSREKDNLCPSWLIGELAIFIPYGAKIMQYALENWPTWHNQYKREGKSGGYKFNNSVYDEL